MSIVHHNYPAGVDKSKPANRLTVWLLVAVVLVTFLALTFGDADGSWFM